MDNKSKSTSANATSTLQSASASTSATAPNSLEGAQDLIVKTRKLQIEIEEKNEIINILKEELETLREQSDKYQRENLQLVKDAKRVKFLQDENDFLQDKVGTVEKLELEIKKLKEKLNELDFLKLRVSELEDDKNKAQEEAGQAEKLKLEAESKLGRIPELESEVNKWKSFSQELERARDSIQSKLLESIEQESKLTADNKKVEDEVKRLRDLVKSYEEHRDEEQASISLKSVGNEVMFAVNQELVNENEKLKSELDKNQSNTKEIRDELESNRKLISDLRQDLTCEKSLAKKLTNQLTQFQKQIKSMDKQYFSTHNSRATPTSNGKNSAQTTPTSDKRCGSNQASTTESVPPSLRKSNELCSNDQKDDIDECLLVRNSTTSNAAAAARKIAQAATGQDESEDSKSKVNNFVRNSISSRSVNFGLSKSPVAYLDRIRASVSATTKTNTVTSYEEQSSTRQSDPLTLSGGQNSSEELIQAPMVKQQVRCNAANSAKYCAKDTNYVLNCMLSHDHTERCFVAADSVAPARVQVYGGGQKIPLAAPLVSLAHYQTDHAYPHDHNNHSHHYTQHQIAAANQAVQLHSNMVAKGAEPSRQLNALIDPVVHEQLFFSMLHQQQQTQQQQQHGDHLANCSAQHQQHPLTEQQIAHLNNLHRQHYYHHLHELYQMHHQHHMHMHHLHSHKCPQQQQQRQQQEPQEHQNNDKAAYHKASAKQPSLTKTVGSQFQAPILNGHMSNDPMQQIYANMDSTAAAMQNNRVNLSNEQHHVSAAPQFNGGSDSDNLENKRNQQFRKSPQRFLSAVYGNLPQIDETNGLPHAEDARRNTNQQSALKTRPSSNGTNSKDGIRNSGIALAADLDLTKNKRQQNEVVGCSPVVSSMSSSSPTSSRASSNSSPSSSSSHDSLSASNKLTRTAASRHSTTDLNRRQFSVERELVGQAPMTAKLSRVGSCRGFPHQLQPQATHLISGHQVATAAPIAMNGLPSPRTMNNQNHKSSSGDHQLLLRNPAKAQQPPMKLSKILNIGNVQQTNAHTGSATTASQQCSAMRPTPESSTSSRYKQLNQLAGNLVDIKLNDSLAFSSLRAPKKSSSGSNLLNQSLDSQRNLVNNATKIYAGAKPLASKQQLSNSDTNSNSVRAKNDGACNNNLGELNPKSSKQQAAGSEAAKSSSVWFEYGCV